MRVLRLGLRRLRPSLAAGPTRSFAAPSVSPQQSSSAGKTPASSRFVEKADEVLSNHGGKVALVASALAIYLFYSFYKGGANRTALEDALEQEMPLEPYEVNEVRHANQLASAAFDEAVDRVFARFPSGACSYEELVAAEAPHLHVRSGHLLDRAIHSVASRSGSSEVPIATLLVALSMLVRDEDGAARRVSSLMRVGRRVQGDEAPTLRTSTVELLVRALRDTCQLPSEKLVAETGVKYPFRTYRPKTEVDLVSRARLAMKPPHESAELTESEFEALLLGAEVCAWGECYKHSEG